MPKKTYWLQPPYRCPMCDRPFRKPISRLAYNGNKTDVIPVWECAVCGNQYISYVNAKIINQFPNVSCKYVISTEKAVVDQVINQLISGEASHIHTASRLTHKAKGKIQKKALNS